MNQFKKRFALLLVVAIMCSLSFWLGKRQGSKDAFEKGAKLERERSAWFRASDSNLSVKLFDSGRTEKLRDQLVNGMWISIVPMDELIKNPDASPDDRKAASNVLPRLVEYFYNNPKRIVKPNNVSVANEVDKGLKNEENSNGIDPAEREVLGKLREASKVPMEQLDGMIGAVIDEAHKFDLETQEVLRRHIEQRNFPGQERSVGGVSLMMPSDTGSGRGIDDFQWTGKKIRVSLVRGMLQVNGKEYGSVSKGDTVDLRLLGKVYVNDAERHPITQAEAAPSNGDKSSN